MTTTDLGLDLSKYKLGWSDVEDYVFKPKKGLSKDIVDPLSPYRYGSNSPVVAIDPSGLYDETGCWVSSPPKRDPTFGRDRNFTRRSC